MAPVTSPFYEPLNAGYFHRQWGDEVIGTWSFRFARSESPRLLHWVFAMESAGPFPRGYFDSVRQRFDLAAGLPVSGPLLEAIRFPEEGSCEILVAPVEGEPFPVYLKRARPSLRHSLGLMQDIVVRLRELAKVSRVISNVSLHDFLVVSRSGAALEAGWHPVFSVIREEESQSDFGIACFWGETIARIYAAAKDGWERDLSEYDPAAPRTFRKLLKTLRSGRETGVADSLDELERCLRREMDALRPLSDPGSHLPVPPLGALGTFLLDEFAMEYAEKLDPQPAELPLGCASPFVLLLKSDAGEEQQGSLLPPEGWFEDSLIQGVNRKMAIPFLSNHPNTLRTRALLCEENFSLVISDRRPGVPLPMLLEMKGGIEIAEALRLGEKVRRVLDQFDSAEFDFEFRSPWQIEIFPLRESEMSDWQTILAKPCPEWPAWDLRIRAEVPTEAILESAGRAVWPHLLRKLDGKAFPALIAWMLEWRRLEWASRQGALAREPISWDRRLDSLFAAASEHFAPHNPSHRERLLSLLREGLGGTGGNSF